jgi:glycosyltransferase involved in cell wall biosynthesis
MREVPPVSVVIPTYNRPKLTVRAVESVLAQTLSDFEVIVVDDGSDSSRVYPSQTISDERVRLVRHPTNLGVSAARNTGVKESRFPLIAFLDSDDRWLPGKLANQIAMYAEHPSKDNLLVYSSYYLEKEKTRIVYPLSSKKENQALSDFIFLDGGNLHTSTWLTSRSLLEQFPFDAQFVQCEDYDVLLRMEAAGVEFICCDTPATISNGDLREDRLSSTLNRDSYSKFLKRNRKRLTTMSYVLLESIVLNAADQATFGKRLQNHFRRFLTTPRLSLPGRFELAVTYVIRRGTMKVKARIRQNHCASLNYSERFGRHAG